MAKQQQLFKRLVSKAERSTRNHHKMLRSVLHESAKDIAKHLQLTIKSMTNSFPSMDNPCLSVVVVTRQPLGNDDIVNIRHVVKNHTHLLVNECNDRHGFVLSWKMLSI